MVVQQGANALALALALAHAFAPKGAAWEPTEAMPWPMQNRRPCERHGISSWAGVLTFGGAHVDPSFLRNNQAFAFKCLIECYVKHAPFNQRYPLYYSI